MDRHWVGVLLVFRDWDEGIVWHNSSTSWDSEFSWRFALGIRLSPLITLI